MKFPFGLKLGLLILTLTVGLSSSSVYYFYSRTYELLIEQTTGRLSDVGYMGTFLFDDQTRESIVQLAAKIQQDSVVTAAQIQQISPGETLNSLTPEAIEQYQQTKEFQNLTQILRKIHQAGLHQEIQPLQDHYPQLFSAHPNAALPYLLITTAEVPDRQVLKIIASFAPESEGEAWAGNPIGNLYRPATPVFSQAFDGQIQTVSDYYEDEFYRSLTVAIPIKNRQGQTIAVLGVDYLAGSEADKLQTLKYICLGIITVSFLLSILLSFLLARWLGHPVRQLQIAAQKVRDRNYNIVINLKSKDELGRLADIFNAMVADIRSYSSTLEQQNQQLENYSHILEQRVQERTLALQEANKKLQVLATVDSLTQVANRRHFDECLRREWLKMKRAHSPISLILCDLDYFKYYNDTYGHQLGDECLRQIAQILHRSINHPTDLTARYGGEEFVILLPDTYLQEAKAVAEKVRTAVKDLGIEHQGSPIGNYVTLSLGVASTVPALGVDCTSLIELADKALYQAKGKGRDRIEVRLPLT